MFIIISIFQIRTALEHQIFQLYLNTYTISNEKYMFLINRIVVKYFYLIINQKLLKSHTEKFRFYVSTNLN